jgi:hypothetical protein
MRWRSRLAYAAVLLAVCLSVSACASIKADGASDPEPAEVVAVKGSDLPQVVLTSEAAQNIGVKTEPVRAGSSAGRNDTVVPIAAVLYDPQGLPWVYTSPKELTYVRAQIEMGETAADTAHLRSGPPVGTMVVTVGASELLGAEYGVGGE